MQKQTCSPSLESLQLESEQDRETFSHLTLLLTALTAINSPNDHPFFNEVEVNKERLEFMKQKANHTPVIDAATTVLVTDTEILATMTRGVPNAHSMIAMKEEHYHDQADEKSLDAALLQLELKPSLQILREMDEIIPVEEILQVSDDLDKEGIGHGSSNVFISFPNINSAIRSGSSSTSKPDGYKIQPLISEKSFWSQITESKCGYLVVPDFK